MVWLEYLPALLATLCRFASWHTFSFANHALTRSHTHHRTRIARTQPHYSVFGTLFSVLYFLHLYWTYLIFQVRTQFV